MEEVDCFNLVSPPFLFIRSKDDKKIALSSIRDPKDQIYIKSTPPELRGKEIQAYCNGWFILLDKGRYFLGNQKRFSLWNPLTSEFIHLPPLTLGRKQEINGCILSSNPGNPDCMLILFINKVPSIVSCRISIGYRKWIHQGIQINLMQDDFLCNFVLCDRMVYCQAYSKRKLVKIDLSRPRLVSHVFDDAMPLHQENSCRCVKHLVESCGELFLIYLVKGEPQQVISVEVFSFDCSSMVWREVISFEDKAFFLSSESSFSCPASEEGFRGNHVYFTLYGDESLYIFNMKDKTVTVSLPSPYSVPCCSPVWFMAMEDLRISNAPRQSNDVLDIERKDAVREIVRQAEGEIGKLPWLMRWEKGGGVCWFTNFWGESYPMQNPNIQLNDVTRYCSREGWCLMLSGKHSLLLWNPFVNKVIRLPDLPHESINVIICFSISSSIDQVVVIGLDYVGCSFVGYIHLRQGVWYSFLVYDSFYEIWQCNTLAFCDAGFYCLGSEGKLFFFQENVGCKRLWQPQNPCSSYHQSFLLECDGKLLSVFVGFLGKWVQIFRLNDSKTLWEVVEKLEKHTLYLSHYSSFAITANKGMENRVYFPRFHGKRAVYYCLVTKKLHCHNGRVLESFYNTKEQLHSNWIQPKWV